MLADGFALVKHYAEQLDYGEGDAQLFLVAHTPADWRSLQKAVLAGLDQLARRREQLEDADDPLA